MFATIESFLAAWQYESRATQSILDVLTDASLATSAVPDGRTIGRLGWHITQTIPEMMSRTGLHVAGAGEHDPVPANASAIADAYRASAASLAEQLRAGWTDATLQQTDMMYGEEWTRGQTLAALLMHQAHHRGQLTVLMRIAGLPVPGIYGPAREEWAQMGMEPPPV
ncbi:MAG TPA: DinB family protein [Gemmatimonadaceae bacterium]|nr:DinB family protein [Gemmatimonadaceae bacterium]